MSFTLQQCFGDNATQDINSVVIRKTDLPGLTASTSNTGESLVVGILLKILENFEGSITDENLTAITTENAAPITFNQGDINDDFYLFYWRVILRQKNGNNYRIYQFVFNEYQLYT